MIIKDLTDKKSVIDIRKFIIQEERNFGSNYQSLLKELFDFVFIHSMKDDLKKGIMLEIGEHMYRDNLVMDHEINFFCCLLAIEKLIVSIT